MVKQLYGFHSMRISLEVRSPDGVLFFPHLFFVWRRMFSQPSTSRT